jgi:redox-regulated HSP33 family molecular chaperone
MIMKQGLRSISLGLGLLCAASASWADDNVLVSQHGSGSSITIEQSGNTGQNMAQVLQGPGYYGSEAYHGATILQTNVDGAIASIVQMEGYNNNYSILQRDGGNMTADISTYYGDSSGNIASIEQTGQDLSARIEHMGGWNNQANISQTGLGGGMNVASIVQSGPDNFAQITQVGSGFNASIVQNSFGGPVNSVHIVQQR